MDCAALVKTAADRFDEGDDAAFAACFHDAVTVYAEPALPGPPIVRSRPELEDWIARARDGHPGLDVTISDCEPYGAGAVCDAIVVGGEAPADVWRLALAVRVAGREIAEVRAFWSRDSAIAWLVEFL
jgi:hypothetical protein